MKKTTFEHPTDAAMSAAGLQAFWQIAELWQLNHDDQMSFLGNPSHSEFSRWKQHPESVQLGRDTLERISYVLGIYKALQILFPEQQMADTWIKKPNHAFGGQSAHNFIVVDGVKGLAQVRHYLDYVLGGEIDLNS